MKKVFTALFGLSLLAVGCSDQGMPDDQGLGTSEKSVYTDITDADAVSMTAELLNKANQTQELHFSFLNNPHTVMMRQLIYWPSTCMTLVRISI